VDADDRTIAAIATPGGEGGVGIIRVSGPATLSETNPLLTLDADDLTPREATLTGFTRTGEDEVLDRGLATFFPSPNSYTGEDVLELAGHGSPLLLRTLLEDLLDRDSVRMAEPGEFTRRAFENGKLDLAQADAVASLISARSEAALRSSARQLEGELSDRVEDLRETLVYCRSRIEAGLDFSDQDSVGDIPFAKLQEQLRTARDRIQELIDEGRRGEVLEQGCRTAIVGRPNVGKSSLLNQLLRTDRAIVTAQPGTTRDVISDQIEIDGIPFKLFDTAGIHESPGTIEAEGVERSKELLEESDLVVVLLDGSEPARESDESILRMVESYPTLIVVNKIDREQKLDLRQLDALSEEDVDCSISAKTGEGLDELKDAMETAVLGEDVTVENPLVTQTRHVQALEETLTFIDRALDGMDADRDPTLVAQDLMEAGESIGTITGAITTEDLLDRIFSSFCIGK
jgi:tRNA modification GTPase